VDLGDKASLKREKQDISRGLVSTIVAIPSQPPPRSSSRRTERRSYLEPRTYIRLRVHAISRSCPHLHAAVIIRPGLRDTMRYTGPLFGPGENRARDRSRPLYLSLPPVSLPSSPFLFSARLRSGPDGSTRIQLPRQNQSWSLLDSRGGGHLY